VTLCHLGPDAIYTTNKNAGAKLVSKTIGTGFALVFLFFVLCFCKYNKTEGERKNEMPRNQANQDRNTYLTNKLDHIRIQNSSNLISPVQGAGKIIHFEGPTADQNEVELITKFPPSILFCFHHKLYFEKCHQCKRTTNEAKQNLQRFKDKIMDFS
jgi:hypothetical protein